MFDPRKYPPDVAAGDGLDYRAVQSRRAEAVEGIEIGGRERIIRSSSKLDFAGVMGDF